jgi:hypothetical protein
MISRMTPRIRSMERRYPWHALHKLARSTLSR